MFTADGVASYTQRYHLAQKYTFSMNGCTIMVAEGTTYGSVDCLGEQTMAGIVSTWTNCSNKIFHK